MEKIGIIGGGFSGIITAIHLIKKATEILEIIIFNEEKTLCRGIAFNSYSDKHLLNVATGKMSAFSNIPDDFLNWVMEKPEFSTKDRTLISNSFLPRKLYGDYLIDIWKKTKKESELKGISIKIIETPVSDLKIIDDEIEISLENDTIIKVAQCVIATGNQIPRNPSIPNYTFFNSKKYFQNPWKLESVQNVDENLPVLIIGNGLTMVDTVFGLQENGFKGEIYSISPNGFNILPHRHGGMKYTKLAEEFNENMNLFDIVKLVRKHIKIVREYGVSAEPVIDSLRPFTQKIWQRFTDEEKTIFMRRYRHLWGVARHRIPLHSHDKIQQLRINGKLHINSGKILNFTEKENGIEVEYFDKKDQENRKFHVSRIINCTGPESDLQKMDNTFLKSCLMKGILGQDFQKLGIRTNTETFQILDKNEIPHKNLFTLGSNLRGELWESTAVNELRSQAEKLAEKLMENSVAEISY